MAGRVLSLLNDDIVDGCTNNLYDQRLPHLERRQPQYPRRLLSADDNFPFLSGELWMHSNSVE